MSPTKAAAIAVTAVIALAHSPVAEASYFGRPRSVVLIPDGRFDDGISTEPSITEALLDIRGGSSSSSSSKTKVWHPFPDLARDEDYRDALRTKRSRKRSMSYKDIAKLQSSLHSVEPAGSEEARIQRVYMCRISAERFQRNGIVSADTAVPRAGLLLGTINKERVEPRGKRARTSLSSSTEDTEYCTVAKVHAVWEAPDQKDDGGHYSDCSDLLTAHPRVLAVAEELGLKPVGWVFGYLPETRPSAIAGEKAKKEDGDNGLPVVGLDVYTAATLQKANMKRHKERIDGATFVTLAMDATAGATEAFQLSDVCVQMVSEGMLKINRDAKDATTRKEKVKVRQTRGHDRHVPTKHAILVDGSETELLDSVLCLINTALLSHVGTFAGKSATSSPVKKKSGGLTTKTKKAILRELKEGESDSSLLASLCDFQILLALDQILPNDDSVALCQAVRKWSRGQKKTTVVPDKLKKKLRSVLEG